MSPPLAEAFPLCPPGKAGGGAGGSKGQGRRAKQGSLGTCGQESVASQASRCLKHLAKASITEKEEVGSCQAQETVPHPLVPQRAQAQSPRARSGSEVECHFPNTGERTQNWGITYLLFFTDYTS